ncbi:cell wall metabolism sensor histidine kinase WalK [Ancylothrix sp. C2]|uniref:sensor histidine kinase n=1 Tax=Ancylothrix sp. D3o TaxID=2953691 RepID=UPI0021BB5CB3|nr:cell wall metabolism sensor histidine kinase WalK [Ancylothrix sp. D3o]MCT7950694.1 cell wall metabolism sensor histidine kinase WalK [Ancylothrix sp. D3o]
MGVNWNSIRVKLLTTYLALTGLATSVLTGYLLWSFYTMFMNTKQNELDIWSSALTESVADAMENKNLSSIDQLVQRYGAAETLTLRVFSANGSLLSTSTPSVDKQVPNWLEIPGIKEALQNKTVQGYGKGILSNEDRLYISRPIVRNGRLLGALRLSLTLTQFQKQFQAVSLTILATLGITLLLSGAISAWFARSLAMPVLAMRNFAVRLGGGQFGEKLVISGSDELNELAFELNRMSERLASLDNERRAFLANASHELRTPVSNVKVTLEALEMGAGEDPELRRRFIRTTLDETERLSRLIQDLLDLGRLDAGVAPLEKEFVSVQYLVARAIQAVELRMKRHSITIKCTVPDVQIYGDPERLLQAFLNLLDNAMKYSTSQTQISLVGRLESNWLALKIHDQGAGISERDLPHIFEEFYTGDASRKKGGTGLGLAIAKRIVEAHGGRISVHSTPDEGCTFTLYLPITP